MTYIAVFIIAYLFSIDKSESIIKNLVSENDRLRQESKELKEEMYDLANDFLIQKHDLEKKIDYLSKP